MFADCVIHFVGGRLRCLFVQIAQNMIFPGTVGNESKNINTNKVQTSSQTHANTCFDVYACILCVGYLLFLCIVIMSGQLSAGKNHSLVGADRILFGP